MQVLKPMSMCAALAMSLASASAMAARPADQSGLALQGSPVPQAAIQATVIYSFSALDRDNDGDLSHAEIPLDMVDLRMDFQQADFSGDGALSPAECALYASGEVPKFTGPAHKWNVAFEAPERRDIIIANR